MRHCRYTLPPAPQQQQQQQQHHQGVKGDSRGPPLKTAFFDFSGYSGLVTAERCRIAKEDDDHCALCTSC
jgi:hypothetical protein